jgi:hypothetical protein
MCGTVRNSQPVAEEWDMANERATTRRCSCEVLSFGDSEYMRG